MQGLAAKKRVDSGAAVGAGPCLKGGTSTADDGKNENNYSDNQKNVDICAQHVEADKAQQPQNKKDYENGPKHGWHSPYRRSLEAVSINPDSIATIRIRLFKAGSTFIVMRYSLV
jgi:hypothetical protein